MIPFYTGLGYKLEQDSSNYMQIRFDNSEPFSTFAWTLMESCLQPSSLKLLNGFQLNFVLELHRLFHFSLYLFTISQFYMKLNFNFFKKQLILQKYRFPHDL